MENLNAHMDKSTDFFKVSVIIPVYNVASYLEQSVKSALDLKEVQEVVLVEDGSSDSSLSVCRKLTENYTKVKLFTHPKGMNRGAGASRNLGINNASFPYISFLDADDFFLSNRFANTPKVFAENPEADAVYEPVGTFFENDVAKAKFCSWRKISAQGAENYITYPKIDYSGADFFHSLLRGDNGAPSTIGITIKQRVFKEGFLFNENLQLHQDSELWVRIASKGRFYSGGHRNPVSVRRVHPNNRIQNRSYKSQLLKNEALHQWSTKTDISKPGKKLILRNLISSKVQNRMKSNSFMVKIIWRFLFNFVLLKEYLRK